MSTKEYSVTYPNHKSWKRSKLKQRRSHRGSFRNLNTCPNVIRVIPKSGWESYVNAAVKIRLMGFSTCPSDQVCPPDQLYEQVYKIKVDQGHWGRRSDLSQVDPPSGWSPWPKTTKESGDNLGSCYKQEPQDEYKELVAAVWTKLEPVLREYAKPSLKQAKNNRLEAWISDCALMVCEASRFDLLKLAMALSKYGVPIGSWRKRLKVLAFRRRAVGRDIGEDIAPGKFQKQLRHASEKFWMKVPANEKEDTCPLEQATDFACYLTALAATGPDELNLIYVLASIVMNPELPHKDRITWIKTKFDGYKMSERTFYRTLNSLRARLTIGGLILSAPE